MKREGRRGEGLVGLEQKFQLKIVCKQIEVYIYMQVFTWRVEKYKREDANCPQPTLWQI